MSLVKTGGMPHIPVGQYQRQDSPYATPSGVSATAMAASNAAVICVGQVWWYDQGTHTVDTTFSSALGFRINSLTFANASTRLKVGLATVDAANGPPARATNAAGVITFSVSKTYSTSPGTGWITSVPDSGALSIAHGDQIAAAFQMTVRAGSDTITMLNSTTSGGVGINPSITFFDGTSTYTGLNGSPNLEIIASDGTRGYFFGSYIQTVNVTTQTWSNASSPSEYGNYFLLPEPCSIIGIAANINVGGDADLVLYTDPLGTPSAAKTYSIDSNVVGVAAQGRIGVWMFPAAYQVSAANTTVGVIMKPGATNISAIYGTFNDSSQQKSMAFGTNGYAINRSGGSGAFAAQNSNKDRFVIGLLLGAFDGGGGGGISRARAQGGF